MFQLLTTNQPTYLGIEPQVTRVIATETARQLDNNDIKFQSLQRFKRFNQVFSAETFMEITKLVNFSFLFLSGSQRIKR